MIEECVYCGRTDNLTTEHAPPKLLFPKPRPNNLITVRACKTCNAEGSKDAEYFRMNVCLNAKTARSSSAQSLKPAVLRSLNRQEAPGLGAAFRSSIAVTGGHFTFAVDLNRIHCVINRTVQCLYFHETGRRLPDDHTVTVVGEDYLQQLDSNVAKQFEEDFVLPLAEKTPTVIDRGVFAYTSIHTSREAVSIWGLLFFRVIPFVALTSQLKS